MGIFKKASLILVVITFIFLLKILTFSYLNTEILSFKLVSDAFKDWDFLKDIFIPFIVQPIIFYLILDMYEKRYDLFDDEKDRLSISDDELKKIYYEEQGILIKKYNLLHVILDIPNKKEFLSSIKVHHSKNRFSALPVLYKELPALIRMNTKPVNNLTIRLLDWKREDGSLTLYTQCSDYFNHIITNNSPEYDIGGISIRKIVEGGPLLSNLNYSLASNHIGVSILVISSDNKILVQKRGKNVSAFKKHWSPSASGALNIHSSQSEYEEEVSLYTGVINELKEEVCCKGIAYNEKEIIYIGITRELLRLGKPEMFFYIEVNQESSNIERLVQENIILRKSEQKMNEHIETKWLNYNELPKGSENEYIKACTSALHPISQSLMAALVLYKESCVTQKQG